MARRTGKEALHERVVQSELLKDRASRARRREQLHAELYAVTHWVGCESCHPKCAELKQIDLADLEDE